MFESFLLGVSDLAHVIFSCAVFTWVLRSAQRWIDRI